MLLSLPLAALAAAPLPTLQAPDAEYSRRADASGHGACASGETVVLPFDAASGDALQVTHDERAGLLELRYRMAFNDVTEGWNWHPEAPAQGGDYYRFKFLPLASTTDELGSYHGEDRIGTPQDFRIRTRTDYFFAFDNPDEFYAKRMDDDAGFATRVPVSPRDAARLAAGDLRLAIRGSLSADCISSSTTFWKATAATPVDFTLKKRYLVGKLVDMWFYDAASGRILAQLSAAAR